VRGGEFLRRVPDTLFRVPLHIKIVVASAACSGLAFGLGSTSAGLVRGLALHEDLVAIALGMGLAWALVAALLGAAIVRMALAPLRHLEAAAARIERGELDARAPLSRLADRDVARLVRSFNEALDRQAVYQERLHELARRSLRSEEARSRRIAVELREGPGQRLAALLLRLNLAEREGGRPLGEMIEEARGEIASALDIVGRQAGDRVERLLDDLGLKGALEWQARQAAREHRMDISITTGVVDAVLSRSARISLLLVVQEALENIGRHATARTAMVSVRYTTGHRVVAEIIDDGRGFEPRGMIGGGFGLLRAEERMAILGGRLQVTSSPFRGTKVRAEIPAGIAHNSMPDELSPSGPGSSTSGRRTQFHVRAS
jgi:signal transduction histidine kinase